MNRALSKIWILVILVVFLTGGILVWQWWVPKEESKVPKEKIEEAVPEEIVKDETARFIEELLFISPKGIEEWKIGEMHTIKINRSVKEFSPFTHLTLNKPDGEEVGIISCKIGGSGETVFDWDTKSVLRYCGAGLEEKVKEIELGTHMVAITKDVEGRPILASSEPFSIVGD